MWGALLFLSVVFADEHPLTGRWTGSWHSETTGHHGPIRAKIRMDDDGNMVVRFHGRYAKIFPFWYRTTLEQSNQGDGIHYVAQHDLGKRWGMFTLDAYLEGETLKAQYQSQDDIGGFVLTR